MLSRKSIKIWLLLSCLFFLPSPLPAEEEIVDPLVILQAHYDAAGGLERLKKIRSNFSHGRIRFDGLEGSFKHWEKHPQRYRTEEDYGIISQIIGDSGKIAWLFDTNGQLLEMRDQQTLERREVGRRLELYEHLDPDSTFFNLKYLGVQEVESTQCHVVSLTNILNSDEAEFFFATDTHFMMRSVVRQPDVTIITDFADFRWVQGILVAYYSHTRFVEWEKEEETWTEDYQLDTDPQQALFEPPSRRQDYTFPADSNSVSIPFLFSGNLIHLEVTVDNHTAYWVLDSGASMSVIDREYALEHNLKIEGSIKGYGFGELFDLGFVSIPGYKVGTISFESQKCYVSEGLRAKSYEPEIYGILGYDFLSRFVVELDYDNQIVTFHKPEFFTYEGKGTILDAPLKYRTFTLPVTLENKFKSRWTVDLGSYHSSIHYQFAEKTGLLGRPGVDTVSQGMSGISFETTAAFGCLAIDRFQLPNQLLSYPGQKGQGATALGEIGGNIGNSTLKHFHVFLDYPKQQIILEEGRNFNKHFARDKSGLLIGRSEKDQPMVSFIAAATPAEESGLLAGDIIKAINGTEMKPSEPIMPLRDLLRGTAGTPINISVLRENKKLEFTLVLRDLYPLQATEGCSTHVLR